MYYLRAILLEVKYYNNADKAKYNFIENVIELFETDSFDDLPKLILKSAVLREHSVDKLINILNKKVTKYLNVGIYVRICLVLLFFL